jgi:hypothetical protein
VRRGMSPRVRLSSAWTARLGPYASHRTNSGCRSIPLGITPQQTSSACCPTHRPKDCHRAEHERLAGSPRHASAGGVRTAVRASPPVPSLPTDVGRGCPVRVGLSVIASASQRPTVPNPTMERRRFFILATGELERLGLESVTCVGGNRLRLAEHRPRLVASGGPPPV